MTDAPKGKGGIQGMALGRSDIFNVDPREIRTKDGWNSRDDNEANAAHIAQLALSIAEVGVKNPLTVYWENGAPYVSDGHCRLAATLRAIECGAEIKSIPVQTEGRYSSEADRVLSQIVRNSGKPLAPIEQARVYKRLIDLGWDAGTIAAKVGLSKQRIVDLLTLQAAPADITNLVKDGAVSATLASTVIREARGDTKEAAAKLEGAVARAKAVGKARATAKHVDAARPAPGDLTRHPAYEAGLRRALAIASEAAGSTRDEIVDAIQAELDAA